MLIERIKSAPQCAAAFLSVRYHVGRRHFERMPCGAQHAPIYQYGCGHAHGIDELIHSGDPRDLSLQMSRRICAENALGGAVHIPNYPLQPVTNETRRKLRHARILFMGIDRNRCGKAVPVLDSIALSYHFGDSLEIIFAELCVSAAADVAEDTYISLVSVKIAVIALSAPLIIEEI